MRISVDVISIIPIPVPDYITVEIKTGPCSTTCINVKLSDLSNEELDDLCNKFRRDIFKAAKRQVCFG